jgi:hypothetical protein
MTCNYTWTHKCVVKTFSEFVTGDGFFESAQRVSAHPRFEFLNIVYNDFLASNGHSIDVECYERVAAIRMGAAFTNPNYRVVFIAVAASAQDLSAAIGKCDATATFHPHLCCTMEEGRAWFASQPILDAPRFRR